MASLHNAVLAIDACGLVGLHDVFHHRMYLGRGETADISQPPPPFCVEVIDTRFIVLRGWLSERFGFDLTE